MSDMIATPPPDHSHSVINNSAHCNANQVESIILKQKSKTRLQGDLSGTLQYDVAHNKEEKMCSELAISHIDFRK